MTQEKSKPNGTLPAVGYACIVMNFVLLPIVFTITGVFVGLICLFSNAFTRGIIIIILCICTGFIGASIGGWGLGLGKPNIHLSMPNSSEDNFTGQWICNTYFKRDHLDLQTQVGDVYTITKEDNPNENGQTEYALQSTEWTQYFTLENQNTLKSTSDSTSLVYDKKNDRLILNNTVLKINLFFSRGK